MKKSSIAILVALAVTGIGTCAANYIHNEKIQTAIDGVLTDLKDDAGTVVTYDTISSSIFSNDVTISDVSLISDEDKVLFKDIVLTNVHSDIIGIKIHEIDMDLTHVDPSQENMTMTIGDVSFAYNAVTRPIASTKDLGELSGMQMLSLFDSMNVKELSVNIPQDEMGTVQIGEIALSDINFNEKGTFLYSLAVDIDGVEGSMSMASLGDEQKAMFAALGMADGNFKYNTSLDYKLDPVMKTLTFETHNSMDKAGDVGFGFSLANMPDLEGVNVGDLTKNPFGLVPLLEGVTIKEVTLSVEDNGFAEGFFTVEANNKINDLKASNYPVTAEGYRTMLIEKADEVIPKNEMEVELKAVALAVLAQPSPNIKVGIHSKDAIGLPVSTIVQGVMAGKGAEIFSDHVTYEWSVKNLAQKKWVLLSVK